MQAESERQAADAGADDENGHVMWSSSLDFSGRCGES